MGGNSWSRLTCTSCHWSGCLLASSHRASSHKRSVLSCVLTYPWGFRTGHPASLRFHVRFCVCMRVCVLVQCGAPFLCARRTPTAQLARQAAPYSSNPLGQCSRATLVPPPPPPPPLVPGRTPMDPEARLPQNHPHILRTRNSNTSRAHNAKQPTPSPYHINHATSNGRARSRCGRTQLPQNGQIRSCGNETETRWKPSCEIPTAQPVAHPALVFR